MTRMHVFHGGEMRTTGLCPGCGEEVPRVRVWGPGAARERYDCPACGSYGYGSDGARIRPRVEVDALVFELVGQA